MKKIENECVGCPSEMGCLGDACPNRNVEHFYCDECEEEGTLYEYEGKELCKDCLLEAVPKVEGSDF